MSALQVGFVGAGQMGAPMVDRLIAAGTPVTVYARRPEVRERFERAGAPAVATLAEAARDADVVVLCLYSDAHVLELALGDDGLLAAMRPGSVLALHTTGSPATAQQLAEVGASRDVHVVDAPVSGGPDEIYAGKLAVMLGGESADVQRVREVVSAYADPIFETGALGSAEAIKLINNALFAANIQLAAEAERVGNALGIDTDMLAGIIQRCSGATFVMGVVANFGSTAALVDAAGHFMRKDVDVVTEVAAGLGIDLGLLGQVAHGDAVTFEARAT
jgi:3-hydroxyisobutyrate dehydrogenase